MLFDNTMAPDLIVTMNLVKKKKYTERCPYNFTI